MEKEKKMTRVLLLLAPAVPICLKKTKTIHHPLMVPLKLVPDVAKKLKEPPFMALTIV
jgi:hypothetical protein